MKCGITLTVIAVPCIKVALKILLFQSLPGSQFFILYHIQYYHNPIVDSITWVRTESVAQLTHFEPYLAYVVEIICCHML